MPRKTVLRIADVQGYFAKLSRGELLTHDECVALLASHEELRGQSLVAKERTRHLERDNAALLDALKSTTRAMQPTSSNVPKPLVRVVGREEE